MTESTPASVLDGLTFEAVEWLPSGADTGLVRVRGRWSPGVARPDGLPVLCAAVGGGVSRYESLPDAPSGRGGNGSVWRGAYLLPEAIARSGVWLEWESGERSALPVPAGLDERAAPVGLSVVGDEEEAEEDAGGELIDRAVLADRRARRAEAAEQAQARVASEALRALDALELRGSELEARVAALAAERDALAERAEALERRTPRDEHQRAALADALAAAATARRRARDWQLRMRAAEVARSSDAVRLRVLEAREALTAPLRSERAEQEAEVLAARERAAQLDAEAARAREQAVAAATDLDDARRDFAARLDERVAALEQARAELADREAELSVARTELEDVRAELSEARSYAETAMAEARAAAEAQVAEARAAAEAEVAEARAASQERVGAAEQRTQAAEEQARATGAELADTRRQLADLRADLEAERAARAAAGAEAETARTEAATALADLRAERVARASLEDELDRERAARSALSDALDAETAALASLHAELNAERLAREALEGRPDPAQLEALEAELTREQAARQADQSALAALRDDLAAERAALAEVREQLEALRADVESDRAAARDEVAAQLRAEMESAREADRAVLAALRADLNAERAAREADQAELARLRARVAETEREGGLLDRVAELDRRAAGLADEVELHRRARQQAEAAAAAATGTTEQSSRVVADLDAAASALRERTPNGTTVAPAADEAAVEAPAEAPAVEATDEAAVEAPVEAPAVEAIDEARAAADAAIAPAAAPPERERRPIVSASSGPSRALATGRSQRQYPWLRGALVKLAHDDPQAAGKLIAGLLPVQSVIVQGPVDYDLTISEVGTFSVTVAGGRAYVQQIEEPRGRRQAEFHVTAEALALAELIAGVPHRLSRFRGPVRISGRKRRHKPLKAIPAARLSLAEAARAGARLEPGLIFRTFPYVIHAAWSRDHHFTVAQTVTSDPPGTWYVTVGNGQGIRVHTAPPEGGADATVTMTPEGFAHLLRGEPAPRGHRPVVRGDREAVALLKAWIDRAQAS